MGLSNSCWLSRHIGGIMGNYGELWGNYGGLMVKAIVGLSNSCWLSRHIGGIMGNYGELWGNYGGIMGNLGGIMGNYGELWWNYGESWGNYGGSRPHQCKMGLISFAIPSLDSPPHCPPSLPPDTEPSAQVPKFGSPNFKGVGRTCTAMGGNCSMEYQGTTSRKTPGNPPNPH